MKEKEPLFGKTVSELKEICSKAGLPSYSARQIAKWLYGKDISSISQMTDLSLKHREVLSESYDYGLVPPVDCAVSSDGTRKYLYKYNANDYVEAVMIPDRERVTLCVSTQIGCRMNCAFCATARQGFKRNLTCSQILNIIRSLPEFHRITNIVYMGMGEPLDNYANVKKSIEVLTGQWGFGFSPRRITLSTSGYIPFLKEFLEETDVHLAISLHSPFPTQRKEIMPVEKTYKMEDVIKLLKRYDWTGQRRLTFEYILFKGFNDRKQHALGLVRLLGNLPCRINIIPFHSIPDSPFCGADMPDMQNFRDFLSAKGLTCTIRASRGQDILAACGLLSTKKIMENGK